MRNQVYIQKPTNWIAIAVKVLALVALVVVTNYGFADRIKLLYATSRWFTLVFYLGIWGVSASALVIAAFQPKKIVRLGWALLLSISAGVAFFYTSVSGSDLSVFDALSLWAAKHEAHRALAFYQSGFINAILVFVASFVVIAIPPVPNNRWLSLGLKWLSWTPAVPVLLIAAIIVLKEGGGSQALPSQFQPLAVGLVTAIKTASQTRHSRKKVAIKADQPHLAKNIVMLIDESVRPDYFNWKPGNPYTPKLAANKHNIVNFGQAASGGNCSSYSNAILRLGGTSNDISTSITTNPTIWQYAKQAGYRTVYIDGQTGLNKNPGLLQNFMSINETKNIDRLVHFTDVPSPQLDFKLLEVIRKELASPNSVFIYANKNGAHFPYDEGYPKSQSVFEPTITQAGEDINDTRLNSYLNVIRWSVDKFFGHFFDQLDLTETTVIYTSDHGQALFNGQLTHCSVKDPDPREGLVPLFALTGNSELKARFEQGARLNKFTASHFSIRPTVLELMGYKPQEVKKRYGPSMFVARTDTPHFTSGDIFGVFRQKASWTPLDLHKNYLEFDTPPQSRPAPMVSVDHKHELVPTTLAD